MPDWCGDHKFMKFRPRALKASRRHLGLFRHMLIGNPTYIFGKLGRAAGSALLVAATIVGPVSSAQSQGSVPVVRDAEIEALVRDYARPIFKAAGLSSGVDIILVNDQSFNAFVAGRRMFINTGALLSADTPNEIIGVIAHEAGHLAGGHQDRLRQQLARAQTMAIVGTLLGIGAVAAGAATDNPEIGQAGMGVASGSAEFARRGLMGYQRTEEATADRSAIRYLEATGQSGKGMIKTFQRFQSALSLSGARVDPYQVSHPMPRDRIANLETLVTQSAYYDKPDSAALQQRHDMMRAKIAIFMQGQAGLSRLARRKLDPLAKQYGDALAAYLYGNPKAAAAKSDALIKIQPKSPYFQELRGDAMMKANRPREAAESYAKAVKLDPARSGILQIALGQAYLAMGNPAATEKAVSTLKLGLARDKENAAGYQYLAQAYGQLGNVGEAELAIADQNFYNGNYFEAQVFATRAQQKLKRGTPAWLRAQDIIAFKAPRKKRG
jgi:predicted Zn-dependent protease